MPKRKPDLAQERTTPKKQILYTSQAAQFLDALPDEVHEEFVAKFQMRPETGIWSSPPHAA